MNQLICGLFDTDEATKQTATPPLKLTRKCFNCVARGNASMAASASGNGGSVGLSSVPFIFGRVSLAAYVGRTDSTGLRSRCFFFWGGKRRWISDLVSGASGQQSCGCRASDNRFALEMHKQRQTEQRRASIDQEQRPSLGQKRRPVFTRLPSP